MAHVFTPIVDAIQSAELMGLGLHEYLGIDIANGVPAILPKWLAGHRESLVLIRQHAAKQAQPTP